MTSKKLFRPVWMVEEVDDGAVWWMRSWGVWLKVGEIVIAGGDSKYSYAKWLRCPPGALQRLGGKTWIEPLFHDKTH